MVSFEGMYCVVELYKRYQTEWKNDYKFSLSLRKKLGILSVNSAI